VGDSLDFKLLELIFTKMGIVDSKNLSLDGKSKRILARLINHMKAKGVDLVAFLGSDVYEQSV
jgi:hypothetical protein